MLAMPAEEEDEEEGGADSKGISATARSCCTGTAEAFARPE